MRTTRRQSKKAGLPPGMLIHIGDRKSDRVCIRVTRYDAERLEEQELDSLAELRAPETGVLWIDIVGLHEPAILEQLGHAFKLHPLVVEDMLNTEQRPKREDYGDYLYIVLKRLCSPHSPNARETCPAHVANGKSAAVGELAAEQISIVVGHGYVISVHESESPIYEPIREHLRGEGNRLRTHGASYLAHALIDTVVDSYFAVLETLGEQIEELENELMLRPHQKSLRTLHVLKRETLFMRRAVWPLREVIGGLEREGCRVLEESISDYLRDVYDHTIDVIDTIETYREMLSGMLDIYLSSVSNRLNEILKVLTIISTIFIPLTFIVGIYGMNFEHMPELQSRWGYPAVLIFMAGVAGFMLRFFRKKGWI